jgi:hypothetical protein
VVTNVIATAPILSLADRRKREACFPVCSGERAFGWSTFNFSFRRKRWICRNHAAGEPLAAIAGRIDLRIVLPCMGYERGSIGFQKRGRIARDGFVRVLESDVPVRANFEIRDITDVWTVQCHGAVFFCRD